MGATTQTATSTSGPSNPAVTATQTKLLEGLQGAYDSGVKVFDKPLYPGVGPTTQNAWAETLNAAGNPDYAAGIAGATKDFADIAAGNRFGMDDPGYATLRNKVANDTATKIYGDFNNSGLFGADSNMRAAGEGLGNALAGLDYANFQNDQARQERAASYLPQLFQAGLAPGAAMGAVGSAQDADALAARQAENDLFRRTNDTAWDKLARSSSILSGTAANSGTTTTSTTPTTPWWQSALGLGVALL